jgi:hypothetical protein
MSFTNTDLKRLKRFIERAKETPLRLIERPAIEIECLLARLEAAEKVIEQQSYSDTRTYKAWREAAGIEGINPK